MFTEPKRFDFIKPEIRWELVGNGTSFTLTVSSSVFVKGLFVDFAAGDCILEDNCFDICESTPRRIRVISRSPYAVETLRNSINMISLYDVGRSLTRKTEKKDRPILIYVVILNIHTERKNAMKKFWQDFKKFITRGNVIDMAVGVAVASAFTAIVTAFTKGFISPLLALLTNDSDLAEMKYVIRPEVVEVAADGTETVITAEVALLWGAFVQKIIDFLIIALTLFLVMRIASAVMAHSAKIRENMKNALTDEDEKAAAEAAAAAAAAQAAKEKEEARLAREEALLTEIRDLLKNKA